jgi:sugar phosphate isomerase/epimerase
MQDLFHSLDSEYLRCNFDTGNTFIAGHNPLDYLKALGQYVVHCHIKDVSPALAAAVRGHETGIGCSEVHVGGGVNADNIRACLQHLHQGAWDGVVSLECSGTDENTRKSVEWIQGVIQGLK